MQKCNHCTKTKPSHKSHDSIRRLLTSLPSAIIGLILVSSLILTSILFSTQSTYADASYSIVYDDNVVSNMPVDTNSQTLSDTVPIASSNPIRPGFRFNGWCTVVPTTTSGVDACTGGTTYATGSNWTINQTTTTNNLHLFAMWGENCIGYTKMQDLNSSTATTLLPNTGDTTTVCDVRDNTKYMIGKLADDNYWMLDNLALDLTNSDILNSLSSANTNIDENNETDILTSLKSGNRSAGSQYATAGFTNWDSSSTANAYNIAKANMASKDIVPQGDNDPLSAQALAGSWKVGGYYNYCAASAGSYCYDGGSSPDGVNATSSICPKGWRLPTSNTGGEYATLYSHYNYTTFRQALHLPLSGYFYNNSSHGQDDASYFWSSTRYDGDRMHDLRAYTSNISPSDYNNRLNGFSIRCLLNP